MRLASVVSTRPGSHELAVRMALGAAPRRIVWLVLRDLASIMALGLMTGAALAFASGRLLTRLLLGHATDPATAALAVALLGGDRVGGRLPARAPRRTTGSGDRIASRIAVAVVRRWPAQTPSDVTARCSGVGQAAGES